MLKEHTKNNDNISYTGKELLKPCRLKELKYIVVGTGRCGTVYAAKLLSSINIPCTHEAIFQSDGINACLERINKKSLEVSFISKLASAEEEIQKSVNWFKTNQNEQIIADSSYMAAPYLDNPALKNITIIHIVRHPLKVINSFVAGFEYFNDWCLINKDFEEYHKFIYKYVPELCQKMSPVTRCALYWIRWNQIIEEKSKNHPYFLYRIEHGPNKLFNFLKVNPTNYYDNQKANGKNVGETYNNFDQIPNADIRNELLYLYNKYYGIKKMFT